MNQVALGKEFVSVWVPAPSGVERLLEIQKLHLAGRLFGVFIREAQADLAAAQALDGHEVELPDFFLLESLPGGVYRPSSDPAIIRRAQMALSDILDAMSVAFQLGA